MNHTTFRKVGTILATTMVAGLISTATVSASSHSDPDDVLTVSGSSETTLELALDSTTAAFGTVNPTGSGGTADASNVDGTDPSAGACYEIARSVTVSSNVAYDVKVAAAASNTKLDFLTADPASYVACTGGEPVSAAPDPVMFASATPPGEWATGASPVAGATHGFWLGLNVRWIDAPNATLGAASLTLTAVVAA